MPSITVFSKKRETELPLKMSPVPKRAIALSNKKGWTLRKSPAHCYDEM